MGQPGTLTKAWNAFSSTLKGDYNAIRASMSRGLDRTRMFGWGESFFGSKEKGLSNLFSSGFNRMGGNIEAGARLGAYGLGVGAVGIGAADFLNPWGFGWGD